MKPFLQLHLQSESEKPQAVNLSQPDSSEEAKQPVVLGKRLNRFVNRAAHKAAGEYRKGGGPGLISK